MKLNELMAESDHEVYFCVVTPDGDEHVFLSSDYHGAHPDVMPELEPLLDRGFYDFDLIMRKDPESDVVNAPEVPMIYVALEPNKKELMLMKNEVDADKESKKDKKYKKKGKK